MEGTRLDFDGETNFVEDLDKVGEKSYFVTFFNLFSRLPKPKVGFGINDPVWLDCLLLLGLHSKGVLHTGIVCTQHNAFLLHSTPRCRHKVLIFHGAACPTIFQGQKKPAVVDKLSVAAAARLLLRQYNVCAIS